MSSSPAPRGAGRLCTGFVAALPVQHAAISTLGDPFGLETVCASSVLAGRLDQLQLDFGAGPCWQARATRAPVLVDDLQVSDVGGWPVLQAAIVSHQIGSAYAFPLTVGSLDIGAVDLYAAAPNALSPAEIAEASVLADIAAIRVLRRAISHLNDPADDKRSSRHIVHQATGMVIAQLRVNADDALVVIRAHAFAADRSVREVAADIVERRLTFDL